MEYVSGGTLFSYFRKMKRFKEVTEAIETRLLGCFPPATVTSQAISKYVKEGGNINEVMETLRNNSISFNGARNFKDTW